MSGLLKISEAASIGVHSMVVLGLHEGTTVSTPQIAEALQISLSHLSKVLQLLTRAEFVTPVRGPNGGYRLHRPAKDIRLIDILEAIDGPLPSSGCLFGRPLCGPPGCMFEPLSDEIRKRVNDYLTTTTLDSVVTSYRSKRNG